MLGHRITRRRLLARGAQLAAAGAVVATWPRRAGRAGVFTASQRQTLDAALARLIPAEGPGDWSAADVGVAEYVERLVLEKVYAGGYHVFDHPPWIQRMFHQFWKKNDLPRVKRIGWTAEAQRLHGLYAAGLHDLDQRAAALAGVPFAGAPAAVQDAVLAQLDQEGSEFFAVLYDHTMEGAYGHPVYRGGTDNRPWDTFGYAGDVHGERFPEVGPADAPWRRFGGYAPAEMAEPGDGSNWVPGP